MSKWPTCLCQYWCTWHRCTPQLSTASYPFLTEPCTNVRWCLLLPKAIFTQSIQLNLSLLCSFLMLTSAIWCRLIFSTCPDHLKTLIHCRCWLSFYSSSFMHICTSNSICMCHSYHTTTLHLNTLTFILLVHFTAGSVPCNLIVTITFFSMYALTSNTKHTFQCSLPQGAVDEL